MRFEGIYTPVVTPHNEDHSINESRFAKVIEHLIKAGVHGLIIAGTTGEYYAQSEDERFHMMGLAKEIIDGRLPLIIGTGAIRTEDSISYAREAKRIGADALLVTTPALCLSHRPRNRPACSCCRSGSQSARHALQLSGSHECEYG